MDGQGEILGDAWRYDPKFHHTAEFLGISKYDRDDFDVQKKIKYFHEANEGKELPETLQEMENLRKKIGSQAQGKTLLNQLYQYSRLSGEQRPKKVVKKSTSPMGAIEKAIQKVVTSTLKSAMKGNI